MSMEMAQGAVEMVEVEATVIRCGCWRSRVRGLHEWMRANSVIWRAHDPWLHTGKCHRGRVESRTIFVSRRALDGNAAS